MVTGILVFVIYLATNLMATAPPQSLDLITDSTAVYESTPVVVPDDSIPPIADIPINIVNEVLYRNVL